MTTRRFTVGERVQFFSGGDKGNVRPGIYTIVRVMPEANGRVQYRAKSATENHERVFDEAELHPMTPSK